MRHIVQIAAFWVVVIVAIRLAVCFPRSLLARVLFSRVGPVRMRGESEERYLLNWGRTGVSWFTQAALLWVAGWAALRWDEALFDDSLVFAVWWTAVIPALAAGALLLALAVFARFLWIRRPQRLQYSAHASPTKRGSE